jgi:hypothetical protein
LSPDEPDVILFVSLFSHFFARETPATDPAATEGAVEQTMGRLKDISTTLRRSVRFSPSEDKPISNMRMDSQSLTLK